MSGLATDGGAHPPDKLAAACAEQITALIEIDEQSRSEAAMQARLEKPALRAAIAVAIVQHHDAVMQFEREQLGEHGTARLSHPLDPRAHEPVRDQLELAVDAVVECAQGTGFEPHFATDQVRTAVTSIIGAWFATAIDIERDWVANGHTIDEDGRARHNPDHDHKCPHVKAWRARRHGKAA